MLGLALTEFGSAIGSFVHGSHRGQIFHLSIEGDARWFGQTGTQRPVQGLQEVADVDRVIQWLTDAVVRLKETFEHVAQLTGLEEVKNVKEQQENALENVPCSSWSRE